MGFDETTLKNLKRLLPNTPVPDDLSVESLQTMLRHLTGLHIAISSFLPTYISENEAILDGQYYALQSGVFMFADVSGFTALSERLQNARGAEGAEALTDTINDYFGMMLEAVAASGGHLLKFAGDALLVFFPEDSPSTIYKAVRAGLRMQRKMAEFFQPIQNPQVNEILGENHHIALMMSIGIANGVLFETLVGMGVQQGRAFSDERRGRVQRDHVIQGILPGLAMEAESYGDRDDVLVTQEIAQVIADEFDLKALEGGFYHVLDTLGEKLDSFELIRSTRKRNQAAKWLFDFEVDSLAHSVTEQVDRVINIAAYISPTVLDQLLASADYRVRSENRFTTTLFIHVTGFSEMLTQWGDIEVSRVTSYLDRFYRRVQEIISGNNGVLARTDPYKLGIKMLVTFGAPVAYPDDPLRAVQTAIEIRKEAIAFTDRILADLPHDLAFANPSVNVSIGITQGESFAGEVGSQNRREYTLMGDAINLAARLMSKAGPNEIIIAQDLHSKVANAFVMHPLEVMHLKGKSKPVEVYSVEREVNTSATAAQTSENKIVGHSEFLLPLELALLQVTTARRRRAIMLVGDAGIGKTRIAKHMFDQSLEKGFKHAWATCQSRNDHVSTLATIVAQLVGINPNEKSRVERPKLKALLESLNIARLEPALADLLWKRESTPTVNKASVTDIYDRVSKMSSDDKKRSGLFSFLTRESEKRVAQTPSEDTRTTGMWFAVEQSTNTVSVCITFLKAFVRKFPTYIVIDDFQNENELAKGYINQMIEQITQGQVVFLLTSESSADVSTSMKEFKVPDLSEAETIKIAAQFLNVHEIGKRLHQLIWDRSSGRPLFIESLIRLLKSELALEMNDTRTELKADFSLDKVPEDIRKLIVSRLDHLTSYAQTVLRAAAVLEIDFTIEDLILLTNLEREEIEKVLLDLIQQHLIEQSMPNAYVFQHGVTQNAIYETLSRAQRLKYHQLALKALDNHPQGDIVRRQRVHHLLKTGQLPQAIEILQEGASIAKTAGDIEKAEEYYLFALTLLPNDKSIQRELELLRNPSP